MKKIYYLLILLCVSCLTGCQKTEAENGNMNSEQETVEEYVTKSEDADIIEPENRENIELEQLNISVDITEHYVRHKGNPSNLYLIDEDNVLWGCGENKYGQLGQGTQDYDFHDDMVKIAENVIHVDYSQRGFVIFITEDNKLYGMGNAGRGALHVYNEVDWTQPADGDRYTVTTPILLMTGVTYAFCGRMTLSV